MTGVVVRAKLRDDVTRLSRQDKRVSAVYNEIQIGLGGSSNKEYRPMNSGENETSQFQQLNDIWIEMKLYAQLVSAKEVKTVNYHWRSVRNWVYIIGLARGAKERDTILHVI